MVRAAPQPHSGLKVRGTSRQTRKAPSSAAPTTSLRGAFAFGRSPRGNKSQPQRIKALADFKEGKITVLVATDIAARGLDIAQLPHVVNYELPHVAEDYVHRIGRTARAGASGVAISFCDAAEHGTLRAIERMTGTALNVAGGSPPTRQPNGGRQQPGRGQGQPRGGQQQPANQNRGRRQQRSRVGFRPAA